MLLYKENINKEVCVVERGMVKQLPSLRAAKTGAKVYEIHTKLYLYESEREKYSHKARMLANDWVENGKHMENLGSITNPNYVLSGEYVRYKISEGKIS